MPTVPVRLRLFLALLGLLVAGGLLLVRPGPAPTAPLLSPTATPSGRPTPGSTPAPTPTPAPPPLNVLRADGATLRDATGRVVRITGVNWFGLETCSFAPHGLWARRWTDLLDTIVAMGFNTIRLPFATQALDPDSRPNGINADLNPELANLSPLEIMDRIIAGAAERNLKVILDRHRIECPQQSELWYTDRYPEERWIADWQRLAARYRGIDAVIGADLHNEPHGPATWGSGDPRTDWRLAAERAGNAILAVNPDWLIIVEGVERTDDQWYWWGGNLSAARTAPVRLVRPDRLVYSPHDYGPGVYDQPWFRTPDFPANLVPLWTRTWAYLALENLAPILVGEFGGRSVDADREGVWQRTLVDFLTAHGLSFTYWSLNPNSGDTGGLLLDDWQTVDQAKLQVLRPALAPLIGNTVRQAVLARLAAPAAPLTTP